VEGTVLTGMRIWHSALDVLAHTFTTVHVAMYGETADGVVWWFYR
jgi:hypothetical protein